MDRGSGWTMATMRRLKEETDAERRTHHGYSTRPRAACTEASDHRRWNHSHRRGLGARAASPKALLVFEDSRLASTPNGASRRMCSTTNRSPTSTRRFAA